MNWLRNFLLRLIGPLPASGTYTPTPTHVSNVASSTAYVSQWLRVGNVVTVSGGYNMTPTAPGYAQFRLSLPIASNFVGNSNTAGAAQEIAGFFQNTGGDVGFAAADATTGQVIVQMNLSSSGNQNHTFHFTYLVL